VCSFYNNESIINKWILNILFNYFKLLKGGYSSIGRTAVCGIVYPCSIQGILLITFFNCSEYINPVMQEA
jgi:hypothetical protein